jgi:hypothetical protein
MGQLMCEKLTSGAGFRRILAGGEDDLVAGRVGQRAHGVGRFSGALIGVNADAAEVVSEALLKESTR